MCGSAFRCIKLLKVNGFALRPPVFMLICYEMRGDKDKESHTASIWHQMADFVSCMWGDIWFQYAGHAGLLGIGFQLMESSVGGKMLTLYRDHWRGVTSDNTQQFVGRRVPKSSPSQQGGRKTILYFLVLSLSSPKLRRNKKLIRDRRSHHVLIQIRFVMWISPNIR